MHPFHFKRTITTAALFFFLTSQGAGVQAAAELPRTSAGTAIYFQPSLPAELGKVEAVHDGRGPLIFHIQEAHGDKATQKSIRRILEYLRETYRVDTVFLEGNSAELHPELLKFFPENPAWTQNALKRLLDWGAVSGPALFLAEHSQTRGFGIEDAEVYSDNARAFAAVLKARKKTKRFLEAMNLQIERLSAPYLSPGLRRFLKDEERFEAALFPLQDWLAQLKTLAIDKLKIDLTSPRVQADWPMLTRIFALQRFEAALDRSAFENEKPDFLKAIARFVAAGNLHAQIKQVLQNALQPGYLPGPQTAQLFEQMVMELPQDFDYRAWPQSLKVIGRLVLQSELDGGELSREIRALTTRLEEALAPGEKEKEVLGLLRSHRLLLKLFKLELSPEDYEAVLAKGEPLWPGRLIERFLALNQEKRVQESRFENTAEIERLFERSLEFYRLARERDRIMTKRVETQMRAGRLQKAVVITGGFHAGPFENYFKDKDWRYVRLTPQMKVPSTAGKPAAAEAGGREPYIQRMISSLIPQTPEKATLRPADDAALALDDIRRLGLSPWLSRAAMAAAVDAAIRTEPSAEKFLSGTAFARELSSAGITLTVTSDSAGVFLVGFKPRNGQLVQVRVSPGGEAREITSARAEMRSVGMGDGFADAASEADGLVRHLSEESWVEKGWSTRGEKNLARHYYERPYSAAKPVSPTRSDSVVYVIPARPLAAKVPKLLRFKLARHLEVIAVQSETIAREYSQSYAKGQRTASDLAAWTAFIEEEFNALLKRTFTEESQTSLVEEINNHLASMARDLFGVLRPASRDYEPSLIRLNALVLVAEQLAEALNNSFMTSDGLMTRGPRPKRSEMRVSRRAVLFTLAGVVAASVGIPGVVIYQSNRMRVEREKELQKQLAEAFGGMLKDYRFGTRSDFNITSLSWALSVVELSINDSDLERFHYDGRTQRMPDDILDFAMEVDSRAPLDEHGPPTFFQRIKQSADDFLMTHGMKQPPAPGAGYVFEISPATENLTLRFLNSLSLALKRRSQFERKEVSLDEGNLAEFEKADPLLSRLRVNGRVDLEKTLELLAVPGDLELFFDAAARKAVTDYEWRYNLTNVLQHMLWTQEVVEANPGVYESKRLRRGDWARRLDVLTRGIADSPRTLQDMPPDAADLLKRLRLQDAALPGSRPRIQELLEEYRKEHLKGLRFEKSERPKNFDPEVAPFLFEMERDGATPFAASEMRTIQEPTEVEKLSGTATDAALTPVDREKALFALGKLMKADKVGEGDWPALWHALIAAASIPQGENGSWKLYRAASSILDDMFFKLGLTTVAELGDTPSFKANRAQIRYKGQAQDPQMLIQAGVPSDQTRMTVKIGAEEIAARNAHELAFKLQQNAWVAKTHIGIYVSPLEKQLSLSVTTDQGVYLHETVPWGNPRALASKLSILLAIALSQKGFEATVLTQILNRFERLLPAIKKLRRNLYTPGTSAHVALKGDQRAHFWWQIIQLAREIEGYFELNAAAKTAPLRLEDWIKEYHRQEFAKAMLKFSGKVFRATLTGAPVYVGPDTEDWGSLVEAQSAFRLIREFDSRGLAPHTGLQGDDDVWLNKPPDQETDQGGEQAKSEMRAAHTGLPTRQSPSPTGAEMRAAERVALELAEGFVPVHVRSNHGRVAFQETVQRVNARRGLLPEAPRPALSPRVLAFMKENTPLLMRLLAQAQAKRLFDEPLQFGENGKVDPAGFGPLLILLAARPDLEYRLFVNHGQSQDFDIFRQVLRKFSQSVLGFDPFSLENFNVSELGAGESAAALIAREQGRLQEPAAVLSGREETFKKLGIMPNLGRVRLIHPEEHAELALLTAVLIDQLTQNYLTVYDKQSLRGLNRSAQLLAEIKALQEFLRAA